MTGHRKALGGTSREYDSWTQRGDNTCSVRSPIFFVGGVRADRFL
jgi:hypothetical protein